MTLDRIRDDIWEQLGEASDLDPDTDVSYSDGPLLTWVANQGQRALASYRDPVTGHILRMHNLVSDLYFQTGYVDSTLDADAPADNQLTFPAADVGDENDRYNGWIVEAENGEQRLIVDYVGPTYTATLHKDWDTSPSSGDTYKLYKRFFLLTQAADPWSSDHIILPVASTRYRAEGNFMELLRIEDTTQAKVLEEAPYDESFVTSATSRTDPQIWYRFGNRIVMDAGLAEQRWFRMEYYRLPTDMVNAADEPEIPMQFHYGIVLWGIWWGHKRAGEAALAYSTKRDLQDFMRSVKTEDDVQDLRSSDHGTLEKE